MIAKISNLLFSSLKWIIIFTAPTILIVCTETFLPVKAKKETWIAVTVTAQILWPLVFMAYFLGRDFIHTVKNIAETKRK